MARATALKVKQTDLTPDDFEDMPEPEYGEGEDDFIERCTGELQDDNPDLADDAAEEVCQMQWDIESEDVYDAADPKRILYKALKKDEGDGKEFILSDETPDRWGDIIAVDGWQLTQFRRNPVALFNHNSDWPVGTWRDVHVENGALRGTLELAAAGTSDRIDEMRRLVEAGILRAVSVGFRPTEVKDIRDDEGVWLGFRYVKQELIETSLVSIPANPNALAVVKSLRISPQVERLIFAKHGKRDRRGARGAIGKHARTNDRNGKGRVMPLAQRIIDLQSQITDRQAELAKHLDAINDDNVSDADLEKTSALNEEIGRKQRQHLALVESEKLIGASLDDPRDPPPLPRNKSLALPGSRPTPNAPPIIARRKEANPIDYIIRAGAVLWAARAWGKSVEETRIRAYGEDEGLKAVCEFMLRPDGAEFDDMVRKAASAPALTTVAGWAAELVQQIYTDLMPLLMPDAILTKLSGYGLSLSFGRNGRIIIPTRSRTPTLAGSFVGEGAPIPVRQGAFTSQTLTPKKLGVITTYTREMNDHSIPAIEGLLRDALQTDTGVAVDSVLIDSNAATTIRPAGLLNGLSSLTPTAGGGLTALLGDLKNSIGALTTNTFGNVRTPVWLLNPQQPLNASLLMTTNGTFPFREEVARGTLNNIPYIKSSTVPVATIVLIDAADFVVVGEEGARFDMSDQATLHMEDTTPLPLVDGAGVAAAPQRSLFQTDSLALRLIMKLNWVQRRAGTITFTAAVTW